MKVFKRVLDFYISSSIHVAFSCLSLLKITEITFSISGSKEIEFFTFFGTIVGYNFVKYFDLIWDKVLFKKKAFKTILFITVVSFFLALYYFFQLKALTQFGMLLFLGLTILYTLPFLPNKKNARNWAGVKIYLVCFCWVGVTVILPILDAELAWKSVFFLEAIQRFILVFVLILSFEIIDLRYDDLNLRTVAQQIGIKNTKILGYFLLLALLGLAGLQTNFLDPIQNSKFLLSIVIILIITFFLYFSTDKRSKYYTSFWVESVPILWWILLYFF